MAELSTRLAARAFRGLAAGLSTTLTTEQTTTLAASSTSAAAALLAALPAGTYPELAPERAQQAAVIFAALASGMTSITGSQVTSIAATSVGCVTAVLQSLPATDYPSVGRLQVDGAVQVFAGLALGLSAITNDQITQIATLAASAVAAIR